MVKLIPSDFWVVEQMSGLLRLGYKTRRAHVQVAHCECYEYISKWTLNRAG